VELALALANGLGVATEQGSKVLNAAVPKFGSLGRSVPAAVFLSQRVIQGFDDLFDFG
jgi:hypothetical protein